MLEKFLKLTPKLSKLFLIFDTSGETLCSYTTNRDRSTFRNLQRTWIQLFAIFSVPKITSRNTPETRKPFFPEQESQKFQLLEFSGKFLWWRSEFQLAKLLFSSRNELWKQGVLFDQIKVSERRTEPKILKWGNFHNKKSRQFHMIKSNKVTLKTRGTYFFYRKPQKLKMFPKFIQRSYWQFSLLGKLHSSEKTQSGQLSQK